MNDLRAELLISIDHDKKLFDFNVTYLRDGGEVNVGWESGGVFNNTHDALEHGRQWFADAKKSGFKRGSRSVPRVWKQAA
jgi:hypothetical protein